MTFVVACICVHLRCHRRRLVPLPDVVKLSSELIFVRKTATLYVHEKRNFETLKIRFQEKEKEKRTHTHTNTPQPFQNSMKETLSALLFTINGIELGSGNFCPGYIQRRK